MNISQLVYQQFADYVFKETGMHFVERDYFRLDKRIKDLMSQFTVNTPEELVKKLAGGLSRDENQLVIEAITNNETYFFRDELPFNALTDSVYPKLRKHFGQDVLKIWYAGCSTGQEIYSTFIALTAKFDDFDPASIDIFASDISLEALEKAKQGLYLEHEVKRGLSPEQIEKFFDEENGKYRIKTEYSSRINFEQQNLLKDFLGMAKYHIVFCRNVLIYQETENRNKILRDIAKTIVPGGVLFMGSGESLQGVDGTGLTEEAVDSTLVFYKD